MEGKKIGFAITGSFCTITSAIDCMQDLKNNGAKIYPIMSHNASSIDTRFGNAQDFIDKLEHITGEKVLNTISQAEPIGPTNMLDILVIAPCTGNTLAKLASGVTDTSVTMAAKAHLRSNKPVLIAISSNDGLSGSASNLGKLLARKHYYFVPFYQDDTTKKPNSLVADLSLLPNAITEALNGKQIQPIFINK